MAENLPKTGGCQCGLIRYAVRGPPVGSIGVCHCRMCQKAMGNVFCVFAPFRSEDVSWTRGKPAKFQSSTIGNRLFCSNCGTPLVLVSSDETITEVTVGSLDRPSEMAPTEQTGIESTIGWTKMLLDLPGRTSGEYNPASHTITNYQHPDHDTTTEDWLHKMKEAK